MRILTFISIVFVILCGCSENDSIVNTDINYDYSIEQSLSCFCPNSGEKVKLFVRADTIADAILLSNSSHLSYSSWVRYRTIKGLFDKIASLDTNLFIVKVSYDREFHYPTYLYVNPKPVIVNDTIISVITDADYTYQTQNYKQCK